MSDTLKQLLADSQFRDAVGCREQSVQSGDAVFRQGDPAGSLYWLEQGRVQVAGELDLDGGRHVRPGFFELGAGDIFGELTLFDAAPRSASVIALEDCKLVVIERDRLLAYMDVHPAKGYAIVSEILSINIHRIRKTTEKLVAMFAWGLQARGIDKDL